MLQEFENIINYSISIGDVITNLLIAFICGFLISIYYRITYKGPGVQQSFLNSLVVLTMITTVVIMVIGNNLARAFGLVGAMSIIRFRTPLKETIDIIYIFFSLAIGMAAGVGLPYIALISTIFIGSILWVLTKTNVVAPPKRGFLLQFTYYSDLGTEDVPYLDVINQYCFSSKLLNVKSIGKGDNLELSYYVKIKNTKMNSQFVKAIKIIEGINHVNLYFDEEQF
ncbi:MAG: DUF4956 domain-containing protein [Bacteroidetes bacterium]|nr:DUF4956 domain-containing protein [Bacteroidota bacterium]